MSYTVTWDDPVVQVRAMIASRDEMEQLAKALANAEKHLPPPQEATADKLSPGVDREAEYLKQRKEHPNE